MLGFSAFRPSTSLMAMNGLAEPVIKGASVGRQCFQTSKAVFSFLLRILGYSLARQWSTLRSIILCSIKLPGNCDLGAPFEDPPFCSSPSLLPDYFGNRLAVRTGTGKNA